MLPVQWEKAKQICHESLQPSSTVQFSRFASVLLRFSLLTLIFLNLQTFGEGLDFCFDASKEGRFGKLQVLIKNRDIKFSRTVFC